MKNLWASRTTQSLLFKVNHYDEFSHKIIKEVSFRSNSLKCAWTDHCTDFLSTNWVRSLRHCLLQVIFLWFNHLIIIFYPISVTSWYRNIFFIIANWFFIKKMNKLLKIWMNWMCWWWLTIQFAVPTSIRIRKPKWQTTSEWSKIWIWKLFVAVSFSRRLDSGQQFPIRLTKKTTWKKTLKSINYDSWWWLIIYYVLPIPDLPVTYSLI